MTPEAPKCNRTALNQQVLPDRGSLGATNHFILSNNHFGLFYRSDINQTAFIDRCAFAILFGLLHGGENVSGLCNGLFRRGENLIGQCDLLGMYRPFADHAKGGGAARLGAETRIIAEIAKRTINGQNPMGATGRNDRRLGPVPRI